MSFRRRPPAPVLSRSMIDSRIDFSDFSTSDSPFHKVNHHKHRTLFHPPCYKLGLSSCHRNICIPSCVVCQSTCSASNCRQIFPVCCPAASRLFFQQAAQITTIAAMLARSVSVSRHQVEMIPTVETRIRRIVATPPHLMAVRTTRRTIEARKPCFAVASCC